MRRAAATACDLGRRPGRTFDSFTCTALPLYTRDLDIQAVTRSLVCGEVRVSTRVTVFADSPSRAPHS